MLILILPVARSTRGCRDTWIKDLTTEEFQQLACAKCYVQVFFDGKPLTLEWPPKPPFLLHMRSDPNTTFVADALEPSSKVCHATLTEEECELWRDCCRAALQCCAVMQDRESTQGVPICPATWDGVSCWSAAEVGTIATQSCPHYYHTVRPSWRQADVVRKCDENGTWAVHPSHGTEVTDYTACFDTTRATYLLKISLMIDFIGHGISIISLSLAVGLITCSRSVRRDFLSRESLRLHLNLFGAMLGLSAFTLALHYVFYDAIANEDNAIYMQNPVWCRMVYVFTTFFRCAAYMAMFSEGLFLHRRISRIMFVNDREPLFGYLVITWVVPVITTMTFVVVRLSLHQNSRCWIADGFDALDLIYMVPNIVALMANFCFLVAIEYSLCTKMNSNTNERRTKVLRNALRATLALVPVFGIQFLFIIYRPLYWVPYEILSAILTSLQGFWVAVVYCFSTKEVNWASVFIVSGSISKNQTKALKFQVECCRTQLVQRDVSPFCVRLCGSIPVPCCCRPNGYQDRILDTYKMRTFDDENARLNDPGRANNVHGSSAAADIAMRKASKTSQLTLATGLVSSVSVGSLNRLQSCAEGDEPGQYNNDCSDG